MNVIDKHSDKFVSAYTLFKGAEGSATAIQIKKGERLNKHITKTKALLICVEGFARFENERGAAYNLKSGDYVLIEPGVIHWVDGIEISELLLLK